MSQFYQPTGLQSNGQRNNAPFEGSVTTYPLTTNAAVVIATGDPVGLVAGSIVPVTANPVSGTLSANSPIGVVRGFEYQDQVRGFVCSDILPANAVSGGFITAIRAKVLDDQYARFFVQANGPVAASFLGGTVGMGGFGAADTVYGASRVFADVATLNANATEPLRIVGFSQQIGNASGDLFTVLQVSWNANTHYFALAAAH